MDADSLKRLSSLPAILSFLTPVPGSQGSWREQESAFSLGHNAEGWHRSLPTLRQLPTSSADATSNELTRTFPHTSGSKAVFSIRVDIHLISGGVIQDQGGTRILACSIIPKLAACLPLNNKHPLNYLLLKKWQWFYMSSLKTLWWAHLFPAWL